MASYISKAQSFNRNFVLPVECLSKKLIEKKHHKYIRNITVIGSTANSVLLNTFVGGSVLYGILSIFKNNTSAILLSKKYRISFWNGF